MSPNSDAHRTLGRTLYLQGKYREAAAELERAVALAPKADRARSYLGDAYLELPGEQHRALQHFSRAASDARKTIPEQPNNYRPHMWLALNAARLGDREEARSEIGVALGLAKKRAEVVFQSAVVYALIGDKENSLAALQQALADGYSAEETRVSPALRSLRGDPRFEELTR